MQSGIRDRTPSRFILILFILFLVICRMRGVTSEAMVMCAVSEDRKFFELLAPPTGSVPGDRVVFDGFPGEPDKQLNPKKKVNSGNDFKPY